MDKREALIRISDLVDEINDIHMEMSSKWSEYANDNSILVFNQKSKKVKDIEKLNLMAPIKSYVSFLNEFRGGLQLDKGDEEFIIDSRIKNVNSIEEKYEDYLNYRDEKGEVSINKCFNDLFGARAIVHCDTLGFKNIKDYLHQDNIQLEEKNERHNNLNQDIKQHTFTLRRIIRHSNGNYRFGTV